MAGRKSRADDAADALPAPLVTKYLHIREEEDRAAYQTHKEMEDVRAPALLFSTALLARMVAVFLREYVGLGRLVQGAALLASG